MKMLKNVKTGACPQCGEEFQYIGSKPQTFCSISCSMKWTRNKYSMPKNEVTCQVCGKVFEAPKSAHRKFCSKSCAAKYSLLKRIKQESNVQEFTHDNNYFTFECPACKVTHLFRFYKTVEQKVAENKKASS